MEEYILERNRKKKELYRANRQYALDCLGGLCSVCGEDDPRLLEFDHKNPRGEKVLIGTLLRKQDRTELDREIKKCQLLCTNCHNEKTIFERQLEADVRGTLHGSKNTYSNKGCRCPSCKLAWSKYMKELSKKRQLTR